MNQAAILRITISLGLLILLGLCIVPKSGRVHLTNWQLVAKTKLRSLNVLYASYTTNGARVQHLKDLNELKKFALETGTDLSLFSTYAPQHKKETSVVYFKPKTYTDDELIFVFEDPILPYEHKHYTEEQLKRLRYIACYTKSGIVYLESKPPELNKSEPDGSRQ